MVYQLKVSLQNSYPKIWRRIEIPSKYNFMDLHLAIQIAFGWQHCHLFQFFIDGSNKGETIRKKYEGDDLYNIDEATTCEATKTKISEYLNPFRKNITYEYDFGDSWTYDIKLEKALNSENVNPICAAGEGPIIPEDCGGFGGFSNYIDILNSKTHPEKKSIKEWMGLKAQQNFHDIYAFNQNEINSRFMEFFDKFGFTLDYDNPNEEFTLKTPQFEN